MTHIDITHNEHQYTVFSDGLLIVDRENKSKVLNRTYKKSKPLHINGMQNDCRNSNLNDLPTKTRSTVIPGNSGINPDMLPTGVYYRAAKENHGEYFDIEFKNLNGKRFRKKTSKSVKISLKTKLEEAKIYIAELIKQNPNSFTQTNQKELDLLDKSNKLSEEYNEIIELSGYDPECQHRAPVFTPSEQEYLKTISLDQAVGKKRASGPKLPENCQISQSMIPSHCYYQAENGPRGDQFIVDGHPKQSDRTWKTSGSKKIPTQEKFVELLKHLRDIEQTDKYDTMILNFEKKNLDLEEVIEN